MALQVAGSRGLCCIGQENQVLRTGKCCMDWFANTLARPVFLGKSNWMQCKGGFVVPQTIYIVLLFRESFLESWAKSE